MLPLGILGAKNVFIVALAVAPTQLKQYSGNLGSNKNILLVLCNCNKGVLETKTFIRC